jgi:hypothetical protein
MPLVKGPPRGSVQVLLEGLTAESILTTRLQSKRTRLASWSKGLEVIIPASVVHWRMLEDGWTFEDGPGVVPDPNLGAKFLYEIYIASDPNYTASNKRGEDLAFPLRGKRNLRLERGFNGFDAVRQRSLTMRRFESSRPSQTVRSRGCIFPMAGNRRHSRTLGWRAPVSGGQFVAFPSFGRGFRAPALLAFFQFPTSSGSGRMRGARFSTTLRRWR